MQAGHLTRRRVLLLPLAFAACAGEEQAFEPLRFNDLPPIELSVTSIAIEQRFVAAPVSPDVSHLDPVPPSEALKAMAQDRLKAFGTSNKAIFAILDASLTRHDDVVIGSMAVSLTIVDDAGVQLGYAEARVQSRHTGRLDPIRQVLYDMTKSMMYDMNIEFEYQIRHHLREWLTSTAAPDTPVQQAPLDQSSAGSPAAPAYPATPPQAAPYQPPAYQAPSYQAPGYQLPPGQTPPYPPLPDQPAAEAPAYQPPGSPSP